MTVSQILYGARPMLQERALEQGSEQGGTCICRIMVVMVGMRKRQSVVRWLARWSLGSARTRRVLSRPK
jgi:hypothetical protein